MIQPPIFVLSSLKCVSSDAVDNNHISLQNDTIHQQVLSDLVIFVEQLALGIIYSFNQ